MRVLVVEDQAELVEILLGGLRAEGLAVDAAPRWRPAHAPAAHAPSGREAEGDPRIRL